MPLQRFTAFKNAVWAVSVALILAGCGDGDEISRSSFEASGETWPLTVESGTVSCMDDNAIFFSDLSGRRFTVNGTSRGIAPHLPHLDEITAVDQDMLRMLREAGDTNPFEPRLNTAKIIEIGLSRC